MSQPPRDNARAGRPQLLLATTNRHKIEELRELLRDAPYELISPRELGLDLDVPETGTSFAENAEIKARAWAQVAGMLALADDSGLEIDALHGEPGIYSARWGGRDMSYPERFRMLLARLDGVPPESRTARYRCAVAIADPQGVRVLTEGVLEGRIADAPRGAGGFGYDPIFEVPELRRTVAELSAAEKHRISHRARAVAAALPALAQLVSA
jgi:XTP/dITP diphosphohydrolase